MEQLALRTRSKKKPAAVTPQHGMPPCYAEVIVDRAVAQLNRPLTYEVPDGMAVQPGSLVKVPLGKSEALGYVLRIGVPVVPRVRFIDAVLQAEPVWGEDLMALARWLAQYYQAMLSQALQSVVPAPVRAENRRRRGQARDALARLEPDKVRPVLTTAQQAAVDRIAARLESGKPGVVLLHGVTGSGKTEVYLAAIEAALARGRQAIVMVPEISLTAQAIDRYESRFGERIAVMHSGLSPAQRLGEWWRLRRGEADIALGARSAVFAPVPRPGLFIVDEEQDTSYKQDRPPRYHARQVAIKRAIDRGAVVVLGSATPSLESMYWAEQGQYEKVALPERVGNLPLPHVAIVDMRACRARYGCFSPLLKTRMDAVLADGGQVVLLHNRRGFSSYLMCEGCGYIPQCPHCDITLTWHLAGYRLKCHYCLHEDRLPPCCPKCSHEPFQHHGAGTQRVEEDLHKFFPQVPVVRMDRDTTSHRNAHRELLAEFAAGRARILLGTQMIAKGLDFPNVRLAGVISADTALGMPDFRAAERAFSLLTQVAGRPGRAAQAGEVILQTYNPEHPAIQLACRHDYHEFYRWELENRRALAYPPFSHFVNVLLTGETEAEVIGTAQRLAAAMREELQAAGCSLLGPAACAIGRLRGQYRWHMVVRGRRVQEITAILKKHVESPEFACQVNLDVDPVSML
ncbi:MAG: replication restart helicase PriA [Candidatus Xenobia bacterium]